MMTWNSDGNLKFRPQASHTCYSGDNHTDMGETCGAYVCTPITQEQVDCSYHRFISDNQITIIHYYLTPTSHRKTTWGLVKKQPNRHRHRRRLYHLLWGLVTWETSSMNTILLNLLQCTLLLPFWGLFLDPLVVRLIQVSVQYAFSCCLRVLDGSGHGKQWFRMF